METFGRVVVALAAEPVPVIPCLVQLGLGPWAVAFLPQLGDVEIFSFL
jgi:hypothetical protein